MQCMGMWTSHLFLPDRKLPTPHHRLDLHYHQNNQRTYKEYVCVVVCVHAYVCAYVCVCICMCVCIQHTCTHTTQHTHNIHNTLLTCVCTCVYVCTCVCAVYTYVLHIHIASMSHATCVQDLHCSI